MHNPEILQPLTIVTAGAGSGKTYRIQTDLARWAKEGLIAPEKIVAVTFTESAAAELRNRIREALVKERRLEDALQLESAYIATIHSYCLRLITEFAFDAGLSPSPRMLNDDEVKILSGRALATSESAGHIMQNIERYGYKTNNPKGPSSEDNFRKRTLDFTAILRSIGKDAGSRLLIPAAEKKIRELYAPVAPSAEPLKRALLDAVKALLENYPDDLTKREGIELKPTPRKALWSNYRDLRKAADGDALDTDWKLWVQLRNLTNYKKKSPLPEGYDDMARAVIAAAASLETHPGPLEDALNHTRALISSVSESLEAYSSDKKKRGLVDYIDMLVEAHKLLDSNDRVLDAFRERVDCLVVDEFQDTNPLQFSLLWALTRREVPALIVGDVKQAIMGFQNADVRLLEELCRQNPLNSKPLPNNYRSSEPLLHWINLIGEGLFGENYSTLQPGEPKFKSEIEHSLEVIDAQETLKEGAWASYTVNRIAELLQDEQSLVWDKKLKRHRRLRGGDIAIICYKNKRLLPYADALRKAGLRCKLEEDGWLESREVQLTWYCLSYVADPGDRHAALYLAATELGNHTLQTALSGMIDNNPLTDELLANLDKISSGKPDRTVESVLDDILEETKLYTIVAQWPDGVEARANLIRLQAECREFMLANRDAMACGGYYGSDIKTFQAWLKGKVERDKDGNKQPEASVVDDDAVQLMTWHKSKGREWHIVAVCGMDDGEYPRLPATQVNYTDFSNLDTILEKAQIEFYPDFNAPETKEKFQAALMEESRENTRRLLYVALTRAREKVILEWPSYLTKSKNKGGGTYWLELKNAAKIALEGNTMTFDENNPVPCRISTILVKTAAEIIPIKTNSTLPVYGRRAIAQHPLPIELTPESITPSSLHNVTCTVPAGRKEESYGSELKLDFAGIDDPMVKGTIIHRAFEILVGHPERAGMLSDAVEIALAPEQVATIAAAVASFDTWLQTTYKPQALQTEVPLLALDPKGTIVSGFADMILETTDGLWVIDHKSDQVPTDALREERFNIYYPQLKCYGDSLSNARKDKQVRGIILNWVSFGMVSVMELP